VAGEVQGPGTAAPTPSLPGTFAPCAGGRGDGGAQAAAARSTGAASSSAPYSLSSLPYGHGQGQGVGHNPAREDSSLWHFCPDHYDVSRPLYVRVCGLKAAIHIDQRGIIWLNLSQLMKLVGKTKKQVRVLLLSPPRAHTHTHTHTHIHTHTHTHTHTHMHTHTHAHTHTDVGSLWGGCI